MPFRRRDISQRQREGCVAGGRRVSEGKKQFGIGGYQVRKEVLKSSEC